MGRRTSWCLAAAWIAFSPSLGIAQNPFTITIIPGANLAGNAPALAAFNRAATQWTSQLRTVAAAPNNGVIINADLMPLGGGILGSASSSTVTGGFDSFRTAMVNSAIGQPGKSIMNSLPTAAQFTATLPGGSALSGNIVMNRANAKSLGLAVGGTDATITFNSNFVFDFDNSNGVTAGQTDFETVAAHEVGHALGFVSVVDFLTASVSPRPMDLYRFANGGAADPANTAQFTTFARSLVTGGDGIFDDIATELRLSTVSDGFQASHWKADDITGINLGIMDPSIAPGVFFDVGINDLRVMHLIGYNPVPEPATILLFAVVTSGSVTAFRRWRRQAVA